MKIWVSLEVEITGDTFNGLNMLGRNIPKIDISSYDNSGNSRIETTGFYSIIKDAPEFTLIQKRI